MSNRPKGGAPAPTGADLGRTALLVLASLWLVLVPSRSSAQAPSLGKVPFTVEADRLVAERSAGRFIAEGHASLRRAEMVVFADRLTFDQAQNRVIAEGNVVLLEGTAVMQCERISLELPALKGAIEAAEIRIKDGVEGAELRGLDRTQVLDRGQDLVQLLAERLERTGSRKIALEGASFRPCPCEADVLRWHVDAVTGSIDVERGAWLVAPVFYVRSVPVFFLPAVYIPLGERRSGLLFPKLSRSGVAGFAGSLPLYLALSRSYDATLEAGYLTARGFLPELELRWAPAVESRGAFRASFLLDRGKLVDGVWKQDRTHVLPRLALAGAHQTRFDEDTQLAVELNVTTDPAYASEFGAEILDRQVEESVSRATHRIWFERGVRLAVGVAFHEDLRERRYRLDPSDPGRDELRELSIFGSAVDGAGAVRQRFLELRLDALPAAVFSGFPQLLGSARLAVQGFWAPSPEVARFARVDFRPAIEWVLPAGDVLTLSPEAALRMTAWSGLTGGRGETAGRLGLILRTNAFAELWGDWGAALHRVRPELSHVFIPFVAGDGPGPFATEDELDLLGTAHQVQARVLTDWWASGRRLVGVRAELGYDFGHRDRAGAGVSELLVKADAALPGLAGWVRGQGSLQSSVELEGPRLTSLVGVLDVQLGRWLGLTGSLGRFGEKLSLATLYAPEELVPSATVPRTGYVATVRDPSRELGWAPYTGFTIGALLRPIPPLSLRAATGVDLLGVAGDPLRFVTTTVGWTSPCDCWRASLRMSISRDRNGPDIHPDFQLLVDLGQLGGG